MLVPVLLALVPRSTAAWGPAGAESFDCAQRKLAYEFGKHLVPRMGEFESLYYALDLIAPNCTVPLAPGTGHVSRAVAQPALSLPGGAKLFVHPAVGDDRAGGTADAPLRTVQEALDRAATLDPTPAVVLRDGVHYVAGTLVITHEHSGLHMIGFPGEQATISGGVSLTGLAWTPFNVSTAAARLCSWTTQPNYNYVDKARVGSASFPVLGHPKSAADCQALCKQSAGCHAYTWHNANQSPKYALACVGRLDDHYFEFEQAGHYSGRDCTATPVPGPGPSPSPGPGPHPPCEHGECPPPPPPPAGPANIWRTTVSTPLPEGMPGLQLDGARATIARYPNQGGGVETSCGYGCMVPGGSAKWTPPDFNRFGNVTYFTDMVPAHKRNDSGTGGGFDNWFSHYMIGIKGLCSVYDPPVSYWCSEYTSGGGAFAFRTPSGVTPTAGALPNSPYKDVSQALFFVWRPARWANWMFEVGNYDAVSGNFTFGKGGNQGARGNDKGGDFYIQNVMEELDYPSEYFYNATTKELFFWHNGTGAPLATTTFEVPQQQVLVNLTGTQWKPVTDIKLTNIRYTATAPTYMERHAVPSAGDWALDRFAAVFLQGTEGVVIDNCTFEGLDGNAVMVSGYNRNATVQNSDFSLIGGNAIVAWGYTNETQFDPGRPGIKLTGYPDAGVDGTDGEHPKFTTVTGNVVREVGLYEKQSSFFIQAKTAQSIITGNVMFNGPRAGINANDGFGGGDEIAHNLVFSSCRESGDHGPFNSWDRQPFLTTVAHGTPSMDMGWREIHHNFFMDNYSPQENVDNDDGSRYYKTHDNFLVYGGRGMKTDFGGHDNRHEGNIYAYVGEALGVCGALDNHEDVFTGNTVVLTGHTVGGPQCHAPGKTVMFNNSYFTPTGQVSECGSGTLRGWQATGNEKGSTVAKTPSDDAIIAWARAKIFV